MRLPEEIRLRVLADGEPVAGAFVRVTVCTERKNDYALGFGPTDRSGRLVVKRKDILNEAEKEREFAIMDFGDVEEDFTGDILVNALNREALSRALEAYETYRDYTNYTLDYGLQLRAAVEQLNRLEPGKLSVEVEKHDGTSRVRPRAVRG